MHAAPETRSDEAFRGIIGDRGRGVFNGKVVVRPKAQRIDARQSNDNLLLGAHAEIDTKPELEIYADDVKCSHGATVGELDPDHLFYLRSRGIDADSARQLLTTAFAASVLERVRDEPWRARLARSRRGSAAARSRSSAREHATAASTAAASAQRLSPSCAPISRSCTSTCTASRWSYLDNAASTQTAAARCIEPMTLLAAH